MLFQCTTVLGAKFPCRCGGPYDNNNNNNSECSRMIIMVVLVYSCRRHGRIDQLRPVHLRNENMPCVIVGGLHVLWINAHLLALADRRLQCRSARFHHPYSIILCLQPAADHLVLPLAVFLLAFG